jgi:protein-tyrosine phosphatase
VFNLRDIGGPTADGGLVRPGLLLRANALVELGEEGDARLAEMRTAIDLRDPGEREHEPSDLARLSLVLEEIPLVDGEPTATQRELVAFNLWLLENRGPHLARVVERLAAPDALPAVFFCSSGKDRTGLVTALVLSALGVSDEDVIADYTLTETLLPESYRQRALARALAGGMDSASSEWFLTVGLTSPASVMEATLADLDARGGAAAYLQVHGLSDTALASLKGTLIER